MVLVLVDGVKVRKARERLGMDEATFCKKVPISLKTLREIEASNHHRPSTVKKVARVLGVHPRSLVLAREGRLLGVA